MFSKLNWLLLVLFCTAVLCFLELWMLPNILHQLFLNLHVNRGRRFERDCWCDCCVLHRCSGGVVGGDEEFSWWRRTYSERVCGV